MSTNRLINQRFGAAWAALVMLFLFAPIVVMACVSVTAAKYASFPWDKGFSLQAYASIAHHHDLIQAVVNSLKVTVAASLIAVVIGTCASIAVVRFPLRGRGLVTLLGSMPLFVPQVLIGLAILLAVSASGMATGFEVLLLGHVVIIVPFVLRVVSASLAGINLHLEWAAQDLGSSKFRAFCAVTLPELRTAIVAGGVMAAIISFDNVSLSVFLAGPTYNVLPVYLVQYAQSQFDGFAAAVSVCMLAASIVGVAVLHKLVGLDKLFGGVSDA